MKIKLQATEWKLGKGVTYEEFFLALQRWALDDKGKPRELKLKGKERVLVVQKHGEFWVCLLVTVRDYRRFCTMAKDDSGGITLAVRDLEEGQRAADFNYLVCHAATGRGVYAYYYHSCHFDDLTRLCRDFYRTWKDSLVEVAANQAGGGDKAKRQAERRYAGLLLGTLLVTPKQIRELVETLKEIRVLELSFHEVQVEKSWGQPLSGIVTSARHSFTFSKDVPIRNLRDKVIMAIERAEVRKGKVVGETEDGVEHIYQLKRNAGTFEELDFDDVAQDLRFDFTSLSGSIVVQKMLAAIDQRPGYFVLPPKTTAPKASSSQVVEGGKS